MEDVDRRLLDLHDLSVGAALLAAWWWLWAVVPEMLRAWPEEAAGGVKIVTGWGRHRKACGATGWGQDG